MSEDLNDSGSLPRPGPLGIVVRLIAAFVLLSVFSSVVAAYPDMVSSTFPSSPLLLFGVALTFYFLPDVLNPGVGRDWGRWPQKAFLLAAGVAAVADVVFYGSFWAPPLGFLLFLLVAFVTGLGGLSFLLSAILALPG